jgi:hypothetical protein
MPVHEKDIRELSPIVILEDSLVFFADSMYSAPMPEDRIEANYQFIRIFKQLLKMPESHTYPFPKLSKKINILNAPDKYFRIFNWELMRNESDARYYGVIQFKNGNITPLIDVSDQIIRGAEDSVFNNNRWYGALYYNIIAKELGEQKVYFLLGWNGNSLNSERKVVEVFGMNDFGQPTFGAPLFNIIDRGKRRIVKRFIYEYQKGSKASLNYDKENDRIIMDHCESLIGDPAKRYTYVPDGSYDALRWSGTHWIMAQDIIRVEVLEDGKAPVEKPIK